MPNEQTSVPLFSVGEILTSANMNISAGTGVPVFSNSTTRDAGFGGAGEKVLAEGQLCYLSDSNIVQYYSGASWATVGPAAAGGLVCVKAETAFSAVSSVTADGIFTSAYTNYKVVISAQASTNGNGRFKLRVGGVSASTNYNTRYMYSDTAGVTGGVDASTASGLFGGELNGSFQCSYEFTLFNPQLAQVTNHFGNTYVSRGAYTTPVLYLTAGNHSTATAYDGIELLPSAGTMTGTYAIYGYAKTV